MVGATASGSKGCCDTDQRAYPQHRHKHYERGPRVSTETRWLGETAVPETASEPASAVSGASPAVLPRRGSTVWRCGISARHRGSITCWKRHGASPARRRTARPCGRPTVWWCGICACHRGSVARWKRHGGGRLTTAGGDRDRYATPDKQSHAKRDGGKEPPEIYGADDLRGHDVTIDASAGCAVVKRHGPRRSSGPPPVLGDSLGVSGRRARSDRRLARACPAAGAPPRAHSAAASAAATPFPPQAEVPRHCDLPFGARPLTCMRQLSNPGLAQLAPPPSPARLFVLV